MDYQTAEAWWHAAMQRESEIDAKELQARRKIAKAHNAQHSICDPDILADQELYILGKMELQEYEAYLLFKHAPKA